MRKMAFILTLAVFASAGLFAHCTSEASLILVTDRAALVGDDYVDWEALGPPTYSPPVSSPFTITSASGGVALEGSNPSGDFVRLDQGTGWNGNFAPGDALLFTNFTGGPMIFDFSGPVAGAGTQVQQSYYGEFVATVSVFDVADTLLGSFSLAGLSDSAGDNSAIFLGVLSDALDIGRIEYAVSPQDVNNMGFTINRMDLVTQVPEPSSLLLLSLGLAGAGMLGRKFRK